MISNNSRRITAKSNHKPIHKRYQEVIAHKQARRENERMKVEEDRKVDLIYPKTTKRGSKMDMYKSSIKWLRNKERKITEQQSKNLQTKIDDENQFLTFKPKISSNTNKLIGNISFEDRMTKYETRRQKSLERSFQSERKNYTFKPKINSNSLLLSSIRNLKITANEVESKAIEDLFMVNSVPPEQTVISLTPVELNEEFIIQEFANRKLKKKGKGRKKGKGKGKKKGKKLRSPIRDNKRSISRMNIDSKTAKKSPVRNKKSTSRSKKNPNRLKSPLRKAAKKSTLASPLKKRRLRNPTKSANLSPARRKSPVKKKTKIPLLNI